MNRRFALKGFGLAAGAVLLGGHTPYGQWTVYRKKHLLIGCHREDPDTYSLARDVVAVLVEHLPEAKARVARAPTPGRLVSLLGTGQMFFAVIAWQTLPEMIAGTGAFKPYGALPLRLIAPVGTHALVAHGEVPARHAWLVASALSDSTVVKSGSPPGTAAGRLARRRRGLPHRQAPAR